MKPALPVQDEETFRAEVVRLAKLYGWEHFHTYDSRRSPEGFPDEIMIKPPVLWVAELKRDGKVPTKAQQKWLDLFAAVRIIKVGDYRPRDMDTIIKVLSR